MDTADLRFDHVGLTTGSRLHFAECGDAEGEAVLFLHGWPDSWFSFSRVLPRLPAHLRALAVDQRGFGNSDRPESGYAMVDFAADVVAFLDALAIERATLVGHSFGSFVAREVAIGEPERVNRLVLIGTGFPEASAVTREIRAELDDLTDPVPAELAHDFQVSTTYVPLPVEFFERIVTESLKLPARLWCELFDRLIEYDDAEQLRQITAPTLVIWGDKDALFPRADQDRLVAAIPHASLTVYEETGHCPNWERPERVATNIDAFMREG